MVRFAIAICLVLGCLALAGADDRKTPPLPTGVKATADAVLAAKRDAARIAALAARTKPDAFRVAAALCNRDEYDAALAYARAAPRQMVEDLPAYVKARREGGDDTVAAVRAIYQRGWAHYLAGRFALAQKDIEASRKAAEAIGWKRHVAWATRKVGDTHHRRGDHAEALGFYERALVLARAIGDKSQESLSLHNRGQMRQLAGRLEDAKSDYEAALAIERTLGDPAGLAYELTAVGHIHAHLHDYATGLRYIEEALSVVPTPTTRDQKIAYVVTLQHVAWAAQASGDFTKAARYYRLIVRHLRDLQDEDREASVLENLAFVEGQRGRLQGRLKPLQDALAIRKRQGHKPEIASLYGRLGVLYQGLGRAEDAGEAYERSHATYVDLLKESEAKGATQDTLAYRHSLAIAAGNLGRDDEAMDHARVGVQLARAGSANIQLRQLLRQLGNLSLRVGKATAALPNLREALTLARAEPVRNEAAITDLLHQLGRAHYEGREDQAAAGYFAIATERAKEIRHLDSWARGETYLARIAFRAKNWASSLVHARQAAVVVDEMAEGLAEGEGGGARDQHVDIYHMGIRAAGQLEDPDLMAWFMERGRASSLREAFVHREALLSALPSAYRDRLYGARGRLRAATQAYRSARARGRLPAIRKAKVTYESARDGFRATVADIQRRAKSASAVALPEPDDLKTIQGHLGPHDAYISYWHAWDDVVNALVVRKDGARALTISSSIKLGDRCDALFGDDTDLDMGVLGGLRAHLAGSLSLGKDVKKVLISPMGRMSYLPFGMLFPNRTVALVPSGTTYGLLREDRALRGKRVLGVGDPDYGSVVHRAAIAMHRGGGITRLAALPASGAEVRAVSDTTLLGPNATESGVRQALLTEKRWRAVHFACHGLVDPRRPSFSSLALTADKIDDGFLTCLDVSRLRIPADLVVLSACDTARGKIFKTEGIAGLTRAFMLAGAPRVICSLWKVDDEATKALMVKFYELWHPKDGKTKGLPAAKALKQAQQFIKKQKKWEKPYYWAAWVLWGLPD